MLGSGSGSARASIRSIRGYGRARPRRPHRNDGVSDGTQGILEDPIWEESTFRLFDAIAADDEAALLGVCHTFGVLCRWSGAAHPVLRSPEKGGKSSGLVKSILTEDALRHPWFSRFSAKLPHRCRFSSLDSRLFDLIPSSRCLPHGLVPVSYEVNASTRLEGDALTMMLGVDFNKEFDWVGGSIGL